MNGFSVGDAVAWISSIGSYAEKAVVPAGRLVKLHTGVDLQECCGGMVQGVTAYYLSHLTFELKPGREALVHVAAGGVGFRLTKR